MSEHRKKNRPSNPEELLATAIRKTPKKVVTIARFVLSTDEQERFRKLHFIELPTRNGRGRQQPLLIPRPRKMRNTLEMKAETDRLNWLVANALWKRYNLSSWERSLRKLGPKRSND